MIELVLFHFNMGDFFVLLWSLRSPRLVLGLLGVLTLHAVSGHLKFQGACLIMAPSKMSPVGIHLVR